MRASHVAALIALGAISLPPVVNSASATGAGPRTTPSIGTQLAELRGSDTVTDDGFDYSEVVSGTTAVVGAPNQAKSAGRAYVFARTVTGWQQVAELKGSDTVAGDHFGGSVAISGTTIVVGAPGYAKSAGRAYVFARTVTRWQQVDELKGSGAVANGYFGGSVAISGTTVVVGAPGYAKSAGRAYVFTKAGASWKQAAKLKGSGAVANGYFGGSVAISGTTVVVGAPGYAKSAGRAYVFTKAGASWKQVDELKGSGIDARDYFGYSVAISGTTAVVGAPGYAKSAGRAYVFTQAGASWKQVDELKGSGIDARDYFGYSVAISGTTAVVGAPGHAKSAGREYVFTKAGASWKQAAELKGSGAVANGYFGGSVAISGTTITVAPTTTTTTVAPTTTTTTVPTAPDPSGQSPPAADAYPGFTQALADDFLGTSLNQTTWNGFYQDINQQFGPWLSSHGSVAGSEITMSDYVDAAADGASSGTNRAGTGLSTRTGWTSGMAFVRARADAGAGVTMCIGLIGLNNWPPEIDFYEDFPTTNSRHWFRASTLYGENNSMIWNTNTSVDATQWHTYGVEWNSSTITDLVDGVAWASNPNPSPTGANGFDQPMKLFMQIETGNHTNPSSITPAVVNMQVDWAVVYTPS